jgi:nitrogen fixation protein NifB
MVQIAISPDECAQKEAFAQAKVEAQKKSCSRMLQEHACSESVVHFKFSRLNLCLESESNVGCNYCDTTMDTSVKAFTAEEAIERIRAAAHSDPRLRVIELSASGDALATDATFKVLRMIKAEFPYFTRGVKTNGLLLPRKLRRLKELGVSAVTVVVNAVDPEVGSELYSYVRMNGKKLHGADAFEVLSVNQLEGIRNAVDAGFMVKVKAACIRGVNSEHLVDVARTVRTLGAYEITVESAVPAGKLAGLRVATSDELEEVRSCCDEAYESSTWVLNASPAFISCMFAGTGM